MRCDVCDEEFDTADKLAQHKALMHAGMQSQPAEGGERMNDGEEGEEPDYKRAVNE
ncbi:MAG TPA: hypothetical protein VKT20_04195 [Candidatus Dormibacteraeota bacterium]|nr:hypothetical protein [Candidatus Dormibacteraeota bacterium]